MEMLLALGVDLVLILILTFGIYFPRHHRQDLIVAFLVVNLGVFALAVSLGSMAVGAGFGIGLFGVLSIIRLRSAEINQIDVAYYFGSLVLGLVTALVTIQAPQIGLLAILVVLALAIADSPRLARRNRFLQLRLDRAYLNTEELQAALVALLQAQVTSVTVTQIDQVQDSTLVEVTYRPTISAPRNELRDEQLARVSQ